MIRINLLPHRIAKRRQRRQQFYALAAGMVLLGALIGFGVHMIYAGHIERQEARNAFLKQEIARVDRDIAEIRGLREQIDAMLARKQVIESLQTNRTETVQVFNELAKQMPEGVYLKALKQSGPKINLTGYAQSNARVSTLMRNLEASPHLERADLVEVKAATLNNRRVSEFNLNVAIERPKTDDADKGKGKLPASAGGRP